jgi:hypothetical protein
MKDSAGVIYFPSPILQLTPPRGGDCSYTFKSKAAYIVFACSTLIFPVFKELYVKLINDVLNITHQQMHIYI